PQLVQRVDAVARRHDGKALVLEEIREAVENPKVVVHQQYPASRSWRRKLDLCTGRSGLTHQTTAGVLCMIRVVQTVVSPPAKIKVGPHGDPRFCRRRPL